MGNNDELEKLIQREDIVKYYITEHRIKWWGQQNAKKNKNCVEVNGMRYKGRPKSR